MVLSVGGGNSSGCSESVVHAVLVVVDVLVGMTVVVLGIIGVALSVGDSGGGVTAASLLLPAVFP